MLARRDVDAAADGLERRHQADRADQGRDHEVDLHVAGGSHEAVGTGNDLEPGMVSSQPGSVRFVGHCHQYRAMALELALEQCEVAAGRHRGDLEALRKRLDHIQRRPPDRAGGAEQGESPHDTKPVSSR